jgi:dihydrofolate reductase
VRAIVLSVNVSVDGCFEGPQQDLSWHRVDEELHDHFNTELAAASAFLDGRVTYQLMAEYWPHADERPDSARPEREFARIWRDMPKIVYSRTLTEAGWGTQIRREVDPGEVRALKDQPGGPMYLGGAVLARSFVEHGLVDECHLYVHPVVVGEGRRLFPEAGMPLDLRLLGTRTFGNGVVLLRYATGRPSPATPAS